eukprot:765757-Rhodomonas_salina.1
MANCSSIILAQWSTKSTSVSALGSCPSSPVPFQTARASLLPDVLEGPLPGWETSDSVGALTKTVDEFELPADGAGVMLASEPVRSLCASAT